MKLTRFLNKLRMTLKLKNPTNGPDNAPKSEGNIVREYAKEDVSRKTLQRRQVKKGDIGKYISRKALNITGPTLKSPRSYENLKVA